MYLWVFREGCVCGSCWNIAACRIGLDRLDLSLSFLRDDPVFGIWEALLCNSNLVVMDGRCGPVHPEDIWGFQSPKTSLMEGTRGNAPHLELFLGLS